MKKNPFFAYKVIFKSLCFYKKMAKSFEFRHFYACNNVVLSCVF